MRSRPWQLLILTTAAATTLGLTACVDPANTAKSSDTLAPLVLSPTATTTVATVTVPLGSAVAPPSQTVVLGAGSVSTGGVETTVVGATSTNTADPSVSTTTTTMASSGDGRSYTILASDTMYSIARRCAQTADALATFNGWSDGSAHLIHPGDVIELPCTPSSGGGAAAASPTTTTTVKAAGATTTTTTAVVVAGGTYTIVAGDYLAGIAKKTGTTIDAIVQVNGWPDRNHAIYPGDVIKLPAKK